MAGCRTSSVAIAAATVLALAVAACSHDDKPGDKPRAKSGKGGTLTYYAEAPVRTDPQHMYIGRDLTNFGRTVYRSLVTFPVSEDLAAATTTVPDLATDTGTPSDGARTWQFTLKDGITWQDGKPITCEDFKYGASRLFDPSIRGPIPPYLPDHLDLPTDPATGEPIYGGPLHSSPAGKAAFDTSITCAGKTITYHFKEPWVDFPLAVASLHMMDPFRADQDQGRESNVRIFSNGPYKLEGTWDPDAGGTLVRNEHYDPKTDSTDVRKALPDRIVFVLGMSPDEVTERLIADRGDDRTAVTSTRIPPAYYDRITGEVAQRAVNVLSPYVQYLVPKFTRLTNPQVRRALATALDDTAWVAAGGGDKAMEEATDIVSPLVPGYQDDLFPGGAGDPAKARHLLAAAGVQVPYPITFMYPTADVTGQQAAALKTAWEKAGFAVTLEGDEDTDDYNGVTTRPDLEADVLQWTAGADWPSAITVTAPLFDSRPNLTKDSLGQDIGSYQSAEFERLVDEARQATDVPTQTGVLQQADQVLQKDVAYIPLDTVTFYFLHGSGVTHYMNTAASYSWPDLGAIGVK